jgi:hypothetical protein
MGLGDSVEVVWRPLGVSWDTTTTDYYQYLYLGYLLPRLFWYKNMRGYI